MTKKDTEVTVSAMPKLVHTESSLGWGGQEIRIFTELGRLQEHGWETALYAPESSDIYKRCKDAEITFTAIPFSGPMDLSSIFKVRYLIKKNRPDIIISHSSYDSWVTGLATRCMSVIPKIVRARHISTPVHNTLSYRWFPDAIMTTSDFITEHIKKIGNTTDIIKTFSTGVDLERFKPNLNMRLDIKRKLGLPTDMPIVGGVFVLRSWKGVYDFVETAKHVPDAFFVVAGDGPCRELMMESATTHGVTDRIKFLGHVENVEEVFQAIDITLFPSTANEGIPQTLLQAMATGVPIVASNLPSIKETVAEAGILSTPGDIENFAKGINSLLKDKEKREVMQAAGLGRVTTFDQRSVISDINHFYSNLINPL